MRKLFDILSGIDHEDDKLFPDENNLRDRLLLAIGFTCIVVGLSLLTFYYVLV